jgi:hypothetical protein
MGLTAGLGAILIFAVASAGCFRIQRHGFALCFAVAFLIASAYVALLFVFPG